MQGRKRGTAKMPAEMYARFFKWGAASGKPLAVETELRLLKEAGFIDIQAEKLPASDYRLLRAQRKVLSRQSGTDGGCGAYELYAFKEPDL